MSKKTVLVTGAAGFIGFHTSRRLLARGEAVIGIDNLNEYYDPTLKQARLNILSENPNFTFTKVEIADEVAVAAIFKENAFDRVIHLAAQAGVRYSITHPRVYLMANEVGFFNMIQNAKERGIANFVYASSSSVYGNNTKIPFSVSDPVDHPISLYAATKKSNELTAHTYSHLFGLNTTGLRFFTVYGPYGRPDMALFLFTKAILEGRPIDVYNHGKMKRDFTYVDDIVDGILGSLDTPHRYEVFNLGNHNTVELLYFIECIEKELGKKAQKNLLPMQAGDVPATWADIEHTKAKIAFEPKVRIEEGIQRFVEWYKGYYKV
ncbi:MAG: NAD-dependent epimerase [Fibrobacterota bacterium]